MLGSHYNKGAGLKVCNFIKKEIPTQLFSSEYCETFKNSYFYRTSKVTATDGEDKEACYERPFVSMDLSRRQKIEALESCLHLRF